MAKRKKRTVRKRGVRKQAVKKKEPQCRNLVVVSDLHCGCRMGLCPTGPIQLDSGGTYTPSDVQAKVWAMWREFWDDWVPTVTQGEPFAVVVNGDSVDGVHHGSTTQVSHNLGDQASIAEQILAPVRDACEGRFYMIRGTEAHVGQSGVDEESVAKNLGAVPDSKGRHARYELWANVGDGLVHVMHHIGTTGSSHYEATAVIKELTESYTHAGRNRLRPPDVVARAHRHRHIEVRVPTALGMGISFTTAGWQLRTPFAFKIPGARLTTPQIGGSVIRQGDEELHTRHKIWDIGRDESETVTI